MATIEPNFESICIDPNDDLVLYKKEIVRSRIEKFLYAICSLDNDDLPTPLSRIEEMYKCLVTGVDFITFTPLSRAEKFVMAMLGSYDVELLPTPISRSEILMKKIATGDNNLDDIDNLQSRYEFLLAYIIKAGGFNGGNPGDNGDFYYKLTSLTSGFTTIYDTFDMPVKNAVLRGSTLVNLVGTYKHTISTVNKPIVWGQKRLFLTNIKPNTRYTLRAKITEIVKGNYGPRVQIFFGTYSIGEVNTTTSTSDTLIFTSPAELSSDAHLRLIVTGSEAEATEVDFEILLLEGEYPDIKDIPFFDDMASVKMPVLTTVGKNLFDGEFKLSTYSSGKIIIPNGIISSVSFPYTTTANSRGIGCITQVKPNTNYTISIVDKQENTVLLGDGYNNLNDISSQTKSVLHVGSVDNANHTTLSFTTPSNCNYMIIGCYIKYSYAQSGGTITFNEPPKIQLEENSVLTTYEPHKSNILTCNEEVELRRIGDIKDELNLVTGELTQRIQERVLDGSENWIIGGTGANYIMFRCESYTDMVKSSNVITCDKYAYNKLNNATSNLSVTNSTTTGKICIVTSQKDLSIDNFKAKLNTDKPTIQYQLAEPIVKTIDLSTLDQDGKETELSTFDDITHVTTSSEGLVPMGKIVTSRPIHFVNYALDNGWTTFDNTVEYPVKNAVLKGQTLKNITDYNIEANSNVTIEADGTITITATGTYTEVFLPALEKLPSTKYWVGINVIENTLNGDFVFHATTGVNCIFAYSANITQGFVGVNEQVRTTMADVSSAVYAFRSYLGSKVTEGSIKYKVMVIPYQEGMENLDIPYFTGIQSVKMPVLKTVGKNLYNKTPFNGFIDSANGKFIYNNSTTRKISDYIEVKPNTTYKVSGCTMTAMWGYDKDKNPISAINIYTDYITTTNDMRFIAFNINTEVEYSNIQLEEGTVATQYEPHKSNILTCNEEVELRGIGDIKDELNLVTGELVQKIGTYTFTGDEKWKLQGGEIGGYTYFSCHLVDELMIDYDYDYNIPLICNRLPVITYNDFDNRLKNVGINLTYFFRLNFSDCDSNNGATVEDLKAYLKANPTTVQYPISKSVKTVELSTLDQDGKETKLNTFDDITHVTVSSEGLVPTGDIDIARPIQFVDYSLDNGLTTLYNTIDYPVKNAVLKGQTLVNIAQQYSKFGTYTGDVNFDGEFFSYTKPTTVTSGLTFKSIYGNFEIGKQISIYVNNQSDMALYLYDSSYKIKGTFEKGISSVLFTTDSDSIRIGLLNNSIEANIKVSVMIFEGDCINCEIPYFTGIQSVKIPVLTTVGKNLYSYGDLTINNPKTNAWYYTNGKGANYGSDCKRTDGGNWFYLENGVYSYHSINENTQSTIILVGEGEVLYNPGKEVPSGWYVFRFKTKSESVDYIKISQLQLEKGPNKTSYEPYKSNILTCNEEVELRGIGDIKDELNLTTGELTQRIGEFVFDGSSDELWFITTNGSGFKRFVSDVKKTHSEYSEITNWLPTANKSYWSINENGFYIGTNNSPVIVFNTNDSRYNMTVTEFENYLSQNPLIVQYPLTEETIKTVTLSTLDQDGKETELTTFNNITHVTVSSEGFVPTGEITVATKNATDVIDASIMSLRTDDILNSQRTLEGSANAQSDDIDVTMLGTTDIYEQLL